MLKTPSKMQMSDMVNIDNNGFRDRRGGGGCLKYPGWDRVKSHIFSNNNMTGNDVIVSLAS